MHRTSGVPNQRHTGICRRCATFDSNVALVDHDRTTTMSSSVKQESKVSFTIRRPTPSSSRATSTGPDSDAAATPPHAPAPSFKIPALPRHLTDQGAGSRSGSNSPKPRARTYEERGEESDSSDEERTEDELVTGFDQFGVQRCVFLHFGNAIFSTLSTSTSTWNPYSTFFPILSPFPVHLRFSLPEPVPQLTKALIPVASPHYPLSPTPIHDFITTSFIYRANGERLKPAAPLVIPSLANKDWRALARQRRGIKQPTYIPPSAAAMTGADGSQGGLGTKDTINSGPELRGLQVRKKVKLEKIEPGEEGDVKMEEETSTTVEVKTEEEEEEVKIEPETEDQRAIRLLLSGQDASSEHTIDVIPPPVSETEAFQQDVQILPESATLADYERVPVSQFGAALLRGMGWTPDGPAGKGKHLKGKKAIEPYLPSARPALLGIGAKEKEVLDDGDLRKKKMGRPEKRYVPVIKREGDEARTSRSGSRSRRESPERNERRSETERPRDRDRERSYDDKDRDRERRKEKGKEREYDDRRRDERDRNYDRRRKDDDRDRGRDLDADRDRDRRSSRKDDDYEDRHRRRDRDRDESRSSRRRD